MTGIPSNSLTTFSSIGVSQINGHQNTTVPLTHASISISGDMPQTTTESATSIALNSSTSPSFMQEMLSKYGTQRQTSTVPVTKTKADPPQRGKPRVRRSLTNSEDRPQTSQTSSAYKSTSSTKPPKPKCYAPTIKLGGTELKFKPSGEYSYEVITVPEPGVPVCSWRGKKGIKGETGDEGETGADGIDGADGADGKKGEEGYSCSYGKQFGGTYLMSQDEAIKQCQGKDGSQGPPGPKGPDGEQGPPGKDGRDVSLSTAEKASIFFSSAGISILGASIGGLAAVIALKMYQRKRDSNQ